MPAVALLPEEINTRKSLARSANRAGVIFKGHQVTFPAQAASHLWKAQRTLYQRVMELKEPVERIIRTKQGDEIVRIRDDDALCAMTRALCQVIEQRRVILRIPGPGRDSALESKTINVPSAPTLDVEGIMREAAGAMGATPDAATAPTSNPASASSPSTP